MIISDGIEVLLDEAPKDVNLLNTKGFDVHTATGQRSVHIAETGSGITPLPVMFLRSIAFLIKCCTAHITVDDNNLLHRLADLERMLNLLDGKPVPENRNDLAVRLNAHICKQHSSRF